MRYVLDTNILIEANRQYYGMDFCRAFWDLLDKAIEDRLVTSIQSVRRELVDYEDSTAEWAKHEVDQEFWADETRALQESLPLVVRHVTEKYGTSSTHVTKFLSKADARLVAYAKANGLTLVSHEVAADAATTKVKIPNVCRDLGVAWAPCWVMLRDLKARFVLHDEHSFM